MGRAREAEECIPLCSPSLSANRTGRTLCLLRPAKRVNNERHTNPALKCRIEIGEVATGIKG